MNRNLLSAAIGLTLVILFGYYYFQFMAHENVPGENRYRLANKYLQDGKLDKALKLFDEVIDEYPQYKEAYHGRAITLMKINDFEGAREAFDMAIKLDDRFAGAYANRGILNDLTGNYNDAIKDYKKALKLNPEIAEGPGLIWRFLHNISKKPPSIADRLGYIEAELKKPKAERLLRVPEIDAQQKMYKK